MAQTWLDLLFAHWPVPPEALRPHLPPGLPVDTYEGMAWVGITPFVATVRPRGLPTLQRFPELTSAPTRRSAAARASGSSASTRAAGPRCSARG